LKSLSHPNNTKKVNKFANHNVPSTLLTARGCCPQLLYIGKGYSCEQRNYLLPLAVNEDTYLHSEITIVNCPKFGIFANHNVPLPLWTERGCCPQLLYIVKGYSYRQRNYLLALAVDVYTYLHSKITIVDCPKFKNLANHNVPLPLLKARGVVLNCSTLVKATLMDKETIFYHWQLTRTLICTPKVPL
jgi:hypothetical protein